jgi:tetratricopeptide (TPR) repeat protein
VFHLSVHAQQPLTRDSEEIDFAQQLLNKSQYQLAASEFEEFIRQYPQSSFLPQAYLGAGDSYFFLKSYDKAIDFYQRYAKDFPQGNRKWFDYLRWGQCLYLIGKQDEALVKLTSVDAAAVQSPFYQTLYFYLGQVFMDQKNFQQAVANFEKATQVQTSGGYTPQAYLQWGNILSLQADYTKAMDKYLKAFSLADSDDLKAEVLMKQAQLLFLQQDYAGAAKLFNRVTIDFPSKPVFKEAITRWFNSLLKSQQLDKLIVSYDQQFKDNFQDPAFFQLHLSVVEALLKQNKNDEALVILDKLMAAINGVKGLDRDIKISAMLLRAQAQEGLKNYDAAWGTYSGITKEFVDHPGAYCGMAHLRYVQDKFQQAASLFMDCFNKSKDDPSRDDILYNAFLMYQKVGMKDKAMETAGAYSKQYPQGRWIGDVVLAQADLYTQDQKYDQAQELLKPWMEKTNDPHWPQTVFQMGYNLQLSGHDQDALLAYEKLGDANISTELKYFVLKNSAIIYLKNNDQDKAARALSWIIDNFPPSNLPLKDYLWLAQYWQGKNEAQKMLDVLSKAQKYPVAASQMQGINFFTAEAHRLLNNCAQAKIPYSQIITDKENDPYRGRAYLGRGMCFVLSDDKTDAQKEFENAIALNLEDNFVTMRARFELARLFESEQDFKQAAKLYMMVGLLYKDDQYGPQALLQAGDLLEKANDSQEAQKAYQQILEDYPHSEQALKAKQRLGKVS